MSNPGNEGSQPSLRLEGWKQIAARMGMSERNAQRYVKFGLPVHRLSKGGSVYAEVAELEEWLRDRASLPQPPALPSLPPADSPPAIQPETRLRWNRTILFGAILVAVAALTALTMRSPSVHVRALLNGPENEGDATISSDGRYVAYQEVDSTGARQRLLDLQTKQTRTLESFPAGDRQPYSTVISPDARSVAFLLKAERNLWDVHVRAISGGKSRQITRLDGSGLAWTPDSQSLLVTSRPDEGGAVRAYSIHQLSLERRTISTPPASYWGDIEIAAAPDGMHFAVLRYATHGDGDVWLLSFDGRVERQLTQLHTWVNGLTFTPDGREIVFAPVIGHREVLHRVSVNGGPPVRVSTPGVLNPFKPLIGGTSNSATMVFQERRYVSRVYAGVVEQPEVRQERPLTPLTVAAEFPCLSLDGKRLAWTQPDGVWTTDRRSAPVPLVASDQGKRDLACSPDGKHIAIALQDSNAWHIWIVDVSTGARRRLTSDVTSEARPVWSSSGHFIYWRSDGPGEPRYLRKAWPLANDVPQLVASGAIGGSPSATDDRFYFLESDQRSTLLEVMIGGSSPARRLDHLPALKPNTWKIRGNDIIYGDTRATAGLTSIYRAGLSGGTPELVTKVKVDPDAFRYLSISQDPGEIIWTREENQHDVWIAENFR